MPLRLRKNDDFKEIKKKVINNNTFRGSNKEKFNITIPIIEK